MSLKEVHVMVMGLSIGLVIGFVIWSVRMYETVGHWGYMLTAVCAGVVAVGLMGYVWNFWFTFVRRMQTPD